MRYTKLIAVLLLFVAATGCKSPAGLSKKGIEEKAFVADFLEDMKAGNTDSLMAYISPAYIKKAKPPADALVNVYMLAGYEIEEYDRKTGYVKALIWGTDRGWEHRLTFEVVKEDGKLYLWSNDTEFEYSYINPWIHTDQWINEKEQEEEEDN